MRKHDELIGTAIHHSLTRLTQWTTFKVAGFSGLQRVRLRALLIYAGEARPAYEVIVLDLKIPLAYTMFVDAREAAAHRA